MSIQQALREVFEAVIGDEPLPDEIEQIITGLDDRGYRIVPKLRESK